MTARHTPVALMLLGAALLLTAGALFYLGFSTAEESLALPYRPSAPQLWLAGLGAASIVLGCVLATRRGTGGAG